MTAARERLRPEAESWFKDALAIPRRIASFCLFTQPAPGAPFTLAERLMLRG